MSGILLTRPSGDSCLLSLLLVDRGFDVLIAPMLEIIPCSVRLSLGGVQALVLTSANGVRVLERRELLLLNSFPVYAVGEATAAAARRAGFVDVSVAGGDVESLSRRIIAGCRPDDGVVLHVCGRVTKGGLALLLGEAGLCLRRAVVYDAVPAVALPESVRAAFCAGGIGAVLFFSARSAVVFADLVRGAGLGERMAGVQALCLAPAAADAVDGMGFGRVRCADRPDQAALLALLDDFRPT